MEKQQIFVSYSRKDSRLVKPLVRKIQEAGYNVWIDISGIESTDQFKRVIVSAIRESSLVIFFSSKNSNTSTYTEKEISLAINEKKPVMPILIDKTPFNDSIAFDLVNVDYIDISNRAHYSEQVNRIFKTLSTTFPKHENESPIESGITADEAKKHIPYKVTSFLKKRRVFFILIASIATITLACSLPSLIGRIHPEVSTNMIASKPGRIYSSDGVPLVSVMKVYDLFIDYHVFNSWASNDEYDLINCLLEVDHRKSWEDYRASLRNARARNNRFALLAKGLNADDVNRLRNMYNFSKQSGLIFNERPIPVYNVGDIARRTLGYRNDEGRRVGIIGKYYNSLIGHDGAIQRKYNSHNGHLFDETRYDPQNGNDITLTLDYHLQKTVDETLRRVITADEQIDRGAVVVMDSKNGEIKAMANISRYGQGEVGEFINDAISYRYEPGAIIGPAILETALELVPGSQLFDEHVLIDPRFDKEHLFLYNPNKSKPGPYRLDPIMGVNFCIEYQLAGLADYSSHNQETKFSKRIKELFLHNGWEFDIEGIRKTEMYHDGPLSRDHIEYISLLGTGYGIAMTPIQILTFYNGIANDGIMLKPLLINEINHQKMNSAEIVGTIKYTSLLKNSLKQTSVHSDIGSIPVSYLCSHAYGMVKIGKFSWGYEDEDGQRIWNNTGACFFPSNNPQYSIVCLIATKPGKKMEYTADLPLKIFEEIIANTPIQ